MPPKSNNQKKKEAEAAGRAPKKTKQQENAGKTAAGKKAELQAKRAAERVRNHSKIHFLTFFQIISSTKMKTYGTLLCTNLQNVQGPDHPYFFS